MINILYEVNGNIVKTPFEVDPNTFHIENEANGNKTLYFKFDMDSEIYPYFIHEQIVEYNNLYFTIKEIYEDDLLMKTDFVCLLDKDDFKKNIHKLFKYDSKTLKELLEIILEPLGWTYSGSIKTQTKSVDLKYVTDHDVLNELQSTFNCVFDYDNLNKNLHVVYVDDIPYKGHFVSKQVNATKVEYSSDSYEYYNRVYAYGQTDEDGNTVTFSNINDGKEYVENLEYSNKIISTTLIDERYTDAESLLEAAKALLDKHSKIEASYKIKIIDLAKLNDEEYSMYDYQLRDLVDYADLIRMKRVRHRIVTIDEYPLAPDNNAITLSNQPLTVEKYINSTIVETVKKEQNTLLDDAKQQATKLLNEFATKGYRYETENELYFLDTIPKEKAKYVIRMNLSGIGFSQNGFAGPYITAWTIDGKFNADYIVVDTLSAISANLGSITGGSINIGNGNFVVDENGNAIINGQVYAKGGNISGFSIFENAMTATNTVEFDFTQDDLDTIKKIIMGDIEPTEEQIKRYDLDGNGVISSRDYVEVHNIFSAGNRITTTFEIYPKFNTLANSKPVLDVNVSEHHRTYINRTGALNSTRGDINELYAKEITLNDVDINSLYSPLGAKAENLSAISIWSGDDKTPSIEVSNVLDYKYFLVQVGDVDSKYLTWIFVPYTSSFLSGYFRGIGGFETDSESNGAQMYFLRGIVTVLSEIYSEEILEERTVQIDIQSCWARYTSTITTNSVSKEMYIKQLVGVK